MINEATRVVWDELAGRPRRLASDRFEYLVECELPRHRSWSIGWSAEKAEVEGAGPKGWWLATYSGSLVPVREFGGVDK